MQIMFGTILCALLKGLILTKATNTPKVDITSNILQEENVSIYSDLNFTQDISMSEKSDHHILNFKSDRSYSDSITVRNEREVDEVPLANIPIIPESIERKPTSLRAFVQFDSRITEKVNDIFVTLRWNQPEFTDEIIQGYTVQCFFIEDLKEIQICDDKNITTIKSEHTVHNLTSNTTYYFRVRAHTKIVVGPYTDLINVSTTHENPIPKLLLLTFHPNVNRDIKILDVDLGIINALMSVEIILITSIVYSIQDNRIYWLAEQDLMTLNINENKITKITSFDILISNLCIDFIARNLYAISQYTNNCHIVKIDLTMWENGIIKVDKIFKSKNYFQYISVSPSMGTLYYLSYIRKHEYDIMKYHFDGEIEQSGKINTSSCLFHSIDSFRDIIIDDMNNEEPLIYWLSKNYMIVTDINISMCNTILHRENISDISSFESITIDKKNIYILTYHSYDIKYTHIYVLNKKYASLKSVNADEYVEKLISSSKHKAFYHIVAFDQSLQSYPPMRCLTPDEKVYNFENVNATSNSIRVTLPEPIVKNGCKKYNLPTTIYTISVSCLDNNLNKSEKFNVLRYETFERNYEIQNLPPFTEYKLKFTLSNYYFNQLSINPLDSNVTLMQTKWGRPYAPENISVLTLTPTIAVVHWMPFEKIYCAAVNYEVHWVSVTLVNGMQQKSKQVINVPKRMTDGRFFTKINLPLPLQNYLIYVRAYLTNSSRDYSESLSKNVHIYSEPNNISLNEVDINSMDISWISNISLTVPPTLQYKENATEKWQETNNIKINFNKKIIYHIENLQSGTLYKFRLILRYPEYEENFTWPADERFVFSTLGIPSTPGIIARKYYLLFMLSFIVIVTVICISYFYYLHRRGNNVQFLSSTMIDMELAFLHVPWRNTQFMIDNSTLHYNPDECAVTIVARKQITFTKRLGSGAFGKVFQGNVKNLERSGTEISVAIKTLRKDASSHKKKNLLEEAKLMNRFRHKHVLRLLAVCLDGDSPLLVLELMETDLLQYLRDCRNLEASDSPALRLQDLLAMCEDVSRGCCYLEKLRFVHRDLACRNCLVTSRDRENRVIKIGDFGLARDIYKDDYYRMKKERYFPIRWMAPESLMIEIFTSQSDVWSFGVLMWEITSLGEKPYMDKTDKEVIYHVRAGGRLPMTPNCPSPLYRLMLRCWNAADARPNFKFCLENIIALRKNMEDALLSPVDTI